MTKPEEGLSQFVKDLEGSMSDNPQWNSTRSVCKRLMAMGYKKIKIRKESK